MKAYLLPGRLLAVLFSLLFLAGSALAQQAVTVRASGSDEHDAVKKALVEAIRRVNGVSVESSSTTHQEIRDLMKGVEVEFDFQTEENLDVRTASKGHIRSYDLLSSKPTAEGVEVEVRAVLLRFDPDNPRPGAKKTVVIERFTMPRGALQLDASVEGAPELLSQLQDLLTTRLVRSRKFTVLTRKNLAVVLDEQGFLREKDVDPAERVKLGRLLGADYVVAGRVDLLAVHTERKTVKLTGYVAERKAAEVRLTLSVYNVGSGAILWEESFTRNYDWNDLELKRDSAFRDDGAIARSMLELGSEDLARRLLTRTFPPRVMLVDREHPLVPILYLNAGDSLIALGDEFDLVRRGDPLIDPDTGDTLGYLERKIGRLKVVHVDAKMSRAQLIDATAALLEEVAGESFDHAGLVCVPR